MRFSPEDKSRRSGERDVANFPKGQRDDTNLGVVRPREGADGHRVRGVRIEQLLSGKVEDVYLPYFRRHRDTRTIRALGGYGEFCWKDQHNAE